MSLLFIYFYFLDVKASRVFQMRLQMSVIFHDIITLKKVFSLKRIINLNEVSHWIKLVSPFLH